tara:strand:- start:3864 stop:3998 length:135 start_codon:yes stop_codon:yes gene_type:complete
MEIDFTPYLAFLLVLEILWWLGVTLFILRLRKKREKNKRNTALK